MKKGLIFLLPIFLVLSCADKSGASNAEQRDRNHWEQEGLKGEVKVIIEESYEAEDEFGEITMGRFRFNRNYRYDYKGMPMGSVFYNSSGDTTEMRFQYDNEGNVIGNTTHSSDGELKLKIKMKLDTFGNPVEQEWYRQGEYFGKAIMKYDNQGNATEGIYYGPDGKQRREVTYQYDDEGNMIEELRYGPDGELNRTTIFKYDYQSNMLEESRSFHRDDVIIPPSLGQVKSFIRFV